MNGFYAAYLTGVSGNSILLFIIRDGTIIGVDVGGMAYDGTVSKRSNGRYIMHLTYTIPPGMPMITGSGPVALPTPVALDVELPPDFASGVVVGVQTPFGPVNAKIKKLRDLDQ